MRRFFAGWLLAVLLVGLPTALQGQATAAPTCADSLSQSMAFLRGHWEGRSYSVAAADTTLDALMNVHTQPLFGTAP